jgi:putative membrane protein
MLRSGLAAFAFACGFVLPSAAQNPGTQGGSLTDGQILNLLKTVNDAEVSAGQFANSYTRNAGVRDFASRMINDHKKANEDVASTSSAIGENLDGSAQSSRLAQVADNQAATLKGKSGADYDKAYMAYQLRDHQDVLDMIIGDLMSSAKSDQVRALLRSTQSMVQMHLDQARKVSSSLGG